ncbi:hypothetical protein CGK18_17880 [Vibrio parahaemolyticus]|nr:hypothetical protein CGK21_09280 [Vibrio parahaemolyticus]TOA84586.1 hypothetical protein CGK18_17880 [Vibrio parahaemolyticus]TOB07235.1 hypothetical protein CGK16_15025 [Vibrio parahaemolyticus]
MLSANSISKLLSSIHFIPSTAEQAYRQGINRFRPNRRTLPLSKLSQRFNDSLSNMNKNGH